MVKEVDEFKEAPPYDEDAETCYVGSLILSGLGDPALQRRARDMVAPADFFLEDCRTIFTAAARLIDAGEPVDALTLQADLRRRGQLDEIGGLDGIGRVIGSVPSWSHVEKYARDVLAMSLRRHGVAVGAKLARRLRQPMADDTAEQIVRDAVDELWRLDRRGKATEVYTLGEIVSSFIEEKREGRSPALLSGIDTLDQFAGVFSFGKYTVIAGRPSMGKSTLMRWLTGEWAIAGTPTGLISVEEDRQKIAGNYIAAHAELENDYVAYHDFSQSDFAKADAAQTKLAKAKWFGCDAAFSISEIEAAFDYLVKQKGCKVVGIDHLHLIGSDGRGDWNEQREIKEISRRLKELGKSHGVVMLVAAQLSRPDKKIKVPPPPTLLDLRASGAIEEHADAAILLHREDYYRKDETPTNVCELHIEKNRNGKRGVCLLKAELQHQRFSHRSVEPDWKPASVTQLHFDPLEDL